MTPRKNARQRKFRLIRQKKVSRVMHEWKGGKLKDRYGNIVTNQKQAIAIALSEAGKLKNNKR